MKARGEEITTGEAVGTTSRYFLLMGTLATLLPLRSMDTAGLIPVLRSLSKELAAGPPFAEQLAAAGQRTWGLAVAAALQLLREHPGLVGLAVGGRRLPEGLPGRGTTDARLWVFQQEHTIATAPQQVPLVAADPLTEENFLFVVAPHFCLVICHRSPLLQFSFDPAVVERARTGLRRRLVAVRPDLLARFDRTFITLAPPSAALVSAFSRHLLAAGSQAQEAIDGTELDFLEMLSHEVRTPLTTIRTLTRLLLRRPELGVVSRQHLEAIDRECDLQIERFELLTMAMDHEQGELALHPQAVAVDQLLSNYLERWREQADARGLALDIDPPTDLPAVRADRLLLERILGGLVDRLTRSLPLGSHIQVRAERAGFWLRLQITVLGASDALDPSQAVAGPFRVDAQAGAASLRLPAAQGLVAAMGGKLTLRALPDQAGSTLTLYLPILG